MPTIAIINLQTHVIETFYEDEQPNQQKYGGPWGWSSHTVHIQVPTGLDKNIIKAVPNEISYSFEIDPVKYQTQKENNLSIIREQRNRKLQESDWTLFVDVPLSDEQKNKWKLYRQALRDLPSLLTEDQIMNPSTISWIPLPN